MPFAPGQSGNPSGRPKENGHVKELARAYTEEALNMLAQVMRDDDAVSSARVAAAEALLNRAWGRPAQQITGEDGGAVQIQVVTGIDR